MKTTKFKLRIMNTKPEVSDEEIRAFMDFGRLLEERSGKLKRANRIDLLRKGVILSSAVIVLFVVWLNSRMNDEKDPVGQEAAGINTPAPSSSPAVVDSVALSGDSDNASGEKTQAGSPVIESAPVSAPQVEKSPGNNDGQPAIKATPSPSRLQAESESGEVGYHYVEAGPIDGYPALYAYFDRELVYPDVGIKDSIQGVVTVSFVIGISGQPEKIQIQNSLGAAFDEEAARLIRNMPAWKPATVNGKPVPTRLSMPLTFEVSRIR